MAPEIPNCDDFHDRLGTSVFDKSSVPSKLYKYRMLPDLREQDYYLDEVANQRLYFSRKDQLNDLLEYSAPIVSKPTDELICRIFTEHVRDLNPTMNTAEVRTEVARMIAMQPQSIEERVIEHRMNIDMEIASMGVYCLSTLPKSKRMWMDYADSGTGFCIEYDGAELFEHMDNAKHNHLGRIRSALAIQVQYLTDVPQLDIEINRDWPLWLFASKTKKWDYEKEFRFLFPGFGGNHLTFPPECIRRLLILDGPNSVEARLRLARYGISIETVDPNELA